MLELIEQSRLAVDELIDVMGRASIEAVLALSARQVAGPPQQGKAREGDIVWHGTQAGRVRLKGRQLQVTKPRLRKKGRGANKEVPIPAYEAMQQETIGQRMLEILLQGVSTRRYQRVIPEMADTVGVSKSTVSREAIEASEAALKQLMERRYDELDLLIIYIDGMQFQNQCVLAAVGVDVEGRKHVLAVREGETENAEAAKDLLRHLVERGVDPTLRRCWKGLRNASPSTGWTCPRRSIDVWRPATSWTIRTPACASARAACVAGSQAWPRDGRRQRFWKSRSRSGRSWATGTCGP